MKIQYSLNLILMFLIWFLLLAYQDKVIENIENQGDKELIGYTKVSYCELIDHPEEYDGKQIEVKASHRYGFEWQELLCMKCRGKKKTWLEISLENEDPLKRVLRKLPKDQGIINATFYGVFHTGGSYGDGGYAHMLDLKFMKDLKIISRNGGVPELLPAKIQKQLCNE